MLGVFTGSMSDLCFQHGGSFRAAVAKNQRASGRILRTIPVLSHHKYTYLKNNARSSYACISLCERFTVSVFCCCLVLFVFFFCFFVSSHSIGYSAGWSLNAGGGLYKNRAFSLESLEILSLCGAKKLDFNLEFIAQGVSLLVWGNVFLGWHSIVFTVDGCYNVCYDCRLP